MGRALKYLALNCPPDNSTCIVQWLCINCHFQDEVETVREELTFKDHRISELESALRREKEIEAGLENEIHVCDTVASLV